MQTQTSVSHTYTYSKSTITNLDDLVPEQEGNYSQLPTTESFTVCVRVRPLNSRELNKKHPKKQSHLLKLQDNMVHVLDPEGGYETTYRRDKTYMFDNVFNEDHNTQSVFRQTMLPLLDNVLNGYNATLFAYGMTGAGKTHTLFGELDPETLEICQPGLIFLTLEELFRKINSSPANREYDFTVKISYLEIYNEQVKDLLKGDDQNLMILEDPLRGVFVSDLTETSVYSQTQVMQLILAGNKRRTMASTSANTFSSRSHALVQVVIERREKAAGIKGTILQSKLSLIDLAGSERAAVTDNRGLRMLEGANINRSLLALGNCINILSDSNKKGAFVPYRDSKLTRLLKDSLGGNTKTIMIACVSPSWLCYEETVNTLKYASRAKNIKRQIHQNVKEVELHVSQYKEIIETLKGEIETLKEQLKAKAHEDSLIEHGGKNIGTSLLEPDFNDVSIIEEEKKIDEASHKIFENLEQNWEISQTLKELNDLEAQNKETLQNLYKHLEDVNEGNRDYREQLLRQIETLKSTMESNEKTKKEISSTLQGNLLDNRKLKEQLMEFASSVESAEDIAIAKKLLQIDKLDMMTQNTQIKKEALNLAKAKSQQNKQISQMEEEMRRMKSALEEKEKMLASNHQLIENLRTQITEQNTSRQPQEENLRSTSPNGSSKIQALYQASMREEKLEQKTTALKSLLLDLEKKITKSLNELDSRTLTQRSDFEDIEVLEALKLLESQTERPYRSNQPRGTDRRTELSEERGRPMINILQSPDDDYEPKANIPKEFSLRANERHYQSVESESRGGKKGQTLVLNDSINSLYSQGTIRTADFSQRGLNLYEKSVQSTRNKVVGNHGVVPTLSSLLSGSQQRIGHRLNTGTNPLETSGRCASVEKNVNVSSLDDLSQPKNAGTLDNLEEHARLDTYNSGPNAQDAYYSNPLPTAPNERVELYDLSADPRLAGEVIGVIDAKKEIAASLQSLDRLPKSGWETKKQNYQQNIKMKGRDQSLGHVGTSLAHLKLGFEHTKNSLSIAGTSRNKFFSSVVDDSHNQEKRGIEIRSLGQERENLKIFRSKLNTLVSIEFTKLNQDTLSQMKELIEEFKVRKYILPIKDQEALKTLGETIMKYVSKSPEGEKHKRSPSIKDGNTGRCNSAKQVKSLAASKENSKENKISSRNQSKERKPSQSRGNESGGKHSRNNSIKTCSGQAMPSNMFMNYTQTVNKIMSPSYSGKPEGLPKQQMNYPVPPKFTANKGLKEKEINNGEPRKFAVSILNILDNQPKYISNAIRTKEGSRSQLNINEGE